MRLTDRVRLPYVELAAKYFKLLTDNSGSPRVKTNAVHDEVWTWRGLLTISDPSGQA